MIDNVEFMGFALYPVAVGGPTGPVDVVPAGEQVVAVYRLSGWSAEDEAIGHKVCRTMEAVGKALGDDKISAREAADLIAMLEPKSADKMDLLVELADRVFAAVSDDGRITRSEAISIAWGLAQSLIRRV